MAEHFERTLQTWIGDRLRGGTDTGRQEVLRHVAETYRLPLAIYYRGTSWSRQAGDGADWQAEDVVHDFLADRLGRADFLDQWMDSGLSLRRWLMNALHFYLKERHRQLSPRDGSAWGLSRVPVDEDPGHAADRLMIGGLVRRAVQEVVERLEAAGQAPHGRAFVRYYLEEKDVAAIADELGKSAGQVKGMLRLARGRFKACFTDLLTRDGVPETRHEQELHAMFEVLDS